jgi:hypothetical protein
MVLDDGGDATKILHDKHPDLLAGIRVIGAEGRGSRLRLNHVKRVVFGRRDVLLAADEVGRVPAGLIWRSRSQFGP